MTGKVYKASLLGLAGLLLAGVFLVQCDLNRQRADPAQGWTRTAPLENAPPVLAFTTVALGGFRGLIANELWIRANDLQQEGKHFEQVQLSDWITKLEPTFVQVWLMQAWNMAYNISVKFTDPEDRWRWVLRGIELLRDDGIRYNPKETLIYRELAWFFQHKMGQNLDDAHPYYKAVWLREMTAVLGGGRPNFEELIHPQTDEARKRAQLLREKYKMDPQAMKAADETYGPLDWRLPEAHAIYWAAVGLEKSKKKDLSMLRRVIYQSLQMAVMRGRVLAVRADGRIRFGPNLALVAKANDAYEKMIAEETEPNQRYAIGQARRNFLREVVYFFYAYGRDAEAKRWFNKLKQAYPDAIPANQSLEEYGLSKVSEVVEGRDFNRTVTVVAGYLENSLLALVEGDDERAANMYLMAQKIRDLYQQRIRGSEERTALPPLADIERALLEDLLDPRTGLNPEARAVLRAKKNFPASTNAPPAAAQPATKP